MKSYILGAGLVVLVGIVLFSISLGSPSSLSVLDKSLGRLFYPFEVALSYSYDGITSVFTDYILLIDTKKENNRLHKEIERLKLENHKLKSALNNLGDLLPVEDYKRKLNFETKSARVVAAKFSGNIRELTIDIGENNGVKVDMGVIVPDGVVGVVSKVLPSISIVRLMIDSRSAIDAVIPNTKVRGIVSGVDVSDGVCRFVFVEHADEIRDGAKLITTGMDQRFPPGLPIGRIKLSDTSKKIDEIKSFAVDPAVDVKNLHHVLVITGINW